MCDAKRGREMVVRGLVVAVSWDSDGNPQRLAILTACEGEYLISPDGLGQRLFGCVRQEVEARIASAGEAGEPVALVEFTPIDQSADDRTEVGLSGPVDDPPPSDGRDRDVEDRDGL